VGPRRSNRNKVIQAKYKLIIKTYRPFWRCYYPNTNALVFVIDSSDKDRIDIAKEELFLVLQVMIQLSILLGRRFEKCSSVNSSK